MWSWRHRSGTSDFGIQPMVRQVACCQLGSYRTGGVLWQDARAPQLPLGFGMLWLCSFKLATFSVWLFSQDWTDLRLTNDGQNLTNELMEMSYHFIAFPCWNAGIHIRSVIFLVVHGIPANATFLGMILRFDEVCEWCQHVPLIYLFPNSLLNYQ